MMGTSVHVYNESSKYPHPSISSFYLRAFSRGHGWTSLKQKLLLRLTPCSPHTITIAAWTSHPFVKFTNLTFCRDEKME